MDYTIVNKFLLVFGSFIISYLIHGDCTDTTTHNIKVGFLFADFGYPLHYKHFKPACDIAIETINEAARNAAYLNVTFSLEWSTTGKTCGQPFMTAPGIASEMYYKHNVMALFGPPCSAEASGVADLAAYWNIPNLSGVSISSVLDQKERYRTFTRTSFKLTTLSYFFLSVFQTFEWNAVAVMWDEVFGPLIALTVEISFIPKNILVNSVQLSEYRNITEALQAAVARGRSK